jgi:hypothetical protein
VRERLGDRARVEQEKPESRKVFGLEAEEIARVTATVYGKRLEELRRKRRGGAERGAVHGHVPVSDVGGTQARGDG